MPERSSLRRSNAARPAGVMRPCFSSSATRLMFTLLQLLVGLRGVRRIDQLSSSMPRLMASVHEAGIEYEHWPSLAPTTELRQLQYAEDARQGVGKRSRAELAPSYVERYTREILDAADLGALVARLPARGAAALMCVERDP